MKTRKPLLKPDRIVRHVSDITPALLAEQHGIRAVICDLDNTLAKVAQRRDRGRGDRAGCGC
jgi:predicted HAD superfamily phosphohydrolase YqeG